MLALTCTGNEWKFFRLASKLPLQNCLPFASKRPTQTTGVRRVIILALHYVLRTAVIETKHLVVQVETVAVYFKPPRQTIARLRIELEMRVKVVIPGRT